MSGADLSRRQFVGAAAAALGSAAPVGCSVRSAGARAGSPAVGDMVVIGAAPLVGADRGFAAFRSAVEAVRAAGVNIVMAPVASEPADAATMLRNLLQLQQHVVGSSGAVRLLSGADSLARLQAEDGIGILPRLGGMSMIPAATPEAMLASIRGLRELGVQVVQPTHYWKNRNGDGCFERTDQRLTVTGRRTLESLEDAGLVVDLSGMGLQSSLEVLERSRKPVLFSHSNAARVHPHRGNLTDEQIDGCARTGGVVGISAFPPLVSASVAPTLEDLLRHVDHVADRVGTRHVGFGLDLDDRGRQRFPSDPVPRPPYQYPEALMRRHYIPELRDALLARGYSLTDVQQILGGNFLRVLCRVWDETGSRP